MKKILAGLICIGMLVLCACGEAIAPAGNFSAESTATIATAAEKTKSAETSTSAATKPTGTTRRSSSKTKAVMEPLQGGPMLYTFPDESGDVYGGAYGIVNQDGKMIAEPQYVHPPQYVYDKEKDRIIGLLVKGDVDENGLGIFTYYTLDGKAKQLNCGTAYEIHIIPGGRYAVVVKTYSEEDKDSILIITTSHGLLDIETNTWAVKPEEGQTIGQVAYSIVSDNAAIGEIWRSFKLVEAWCFDYETGEKYQLPAELFESADYTAYLSDVKWFLFKIDKTFRWYNEAFEHMPQLDNWRIYSFCGAYAHMKEEGNPSHTAFVDREGNIVNEDRGPLNDTIRQLHCYVVHGSYGVRLLDANLQTVFGGGAEDMVREFQGPTKGFVLLDKAYQVKASCDAYGNPLPVFEETQILRTRYPHLWFLVQGSTWRATPDLSRYRLLRDYYVDGYEGEFYEAKIVEAFEEYILISGWQNRDREQQEAFVPPTLIAIDWDGNLYPDCPMEPYFGSVKDNELASDYGWAIDRYYYFLNAGEQGANYFWVEQDGKRGYINSKGEWLFVANPNE